MPAARRGGARATDISSDAVDATVEVASGLPLLKFKKPLSWTAGNPIAEGELVKRLQALYEEISELEQEDLDLDSLAPKAKELVADRLLKHKSKGVQAWTACCIAECLKLFAPNAPYTGKELKVGMQLVVLTC
jgi:sister chromatid cohesion protein PDS5